jgi:multidrug efflux pump subunit AcrA (membrane-fusion protein)
MTMSRGIYVRAVMVIVTIGVLAASVVAVRAWTRGRVGSIPTTVVQKGAFIDYLQVRGEIRPVRSVVLTAPSSSGADMQIVDLVANGATVAAGDVVVQFDSTTQQRTREQKLSEVKQAEADVQRAQADTLRRMQAAETELAQARSVASRAKLDLARTEIVSRVEADKLALLLSNAEHQVKAAEAKVQGERMATAAEVAIVQQKRDKARYDLAETERIIAGLTLRSPAGGSISLLPNFRAGGPFNRSAPEFKRGDRVWFGAAIAELPDLSSVQLTCRLDEADRARVHNGTPVRIRVDAVPDRELSASIKDIALVARPDFSSWPPVRNFDVTVGLIDTDPRLRTGMSASARIELNRLNDVIVVPASAVFQVGGSTVAYVVQRGSAEARPVTVLRRGRDEVAVASGLSVGDRIALQDPTVTSTK